jgi:pantoate--beta-alanine ligase
MEVFATPDTMRAWSDDQRAALHRIGVVPTMGALHGGHLELIAQAAERADRVIVTIFVNPLQFNQTADFDTYPRPVDDDLGACRELGVDAVYAPTASAMYAPEFQTHVEPGALAARLEGPMRPGHFRGVATVVSKLFGATRPHVGLFGQKDYQQLAIIRRMADDLDTGIEIVGVPTVREVDGLAKSSRNVRLTPGDRRAAVVLSRSLQAAAVAHDEGERDAGALRSIVTAEITAEPRADLEYVELVDADSLEAVDRIESSAVLLTAAWFGDVRLIDNQILEGA